ncbi:hypothetical protein AZI86_10015 [Bdellovibrio bacteriovorus]|uniref:Cell wall surface anchor family protein n=1 Tax=Bdellovibrio bacteriovorus TaxID=959 RepID=A0A150WS31_BDEBC|nr:hypothetical protein [Bdellovibrio bacteriovorus]KYG67323.1 hypothetical protein AZI86_10015 [Bdellovibrio bacteriovorus]
MDKFGTFVLGALLLSFSAYATPALLTYQGRIIKSDGSPLEYPSVSFIFQITDPSGACVVYQEQVDGYDMTHSKGIFDTAIGSGSRSFPATGVFTVLDSLRNGVSLSCQGGSTVTLPLHAGRLLRVSFWDGRGWRLISPDSEIRTVPYAGFSTGFTGLLSGDVSGPQTLTSVDKIKGVPVDLTGNSVGKVLSFDGSKFVPATLATGTTGTVTSVTGGTGLVGGTITTSGTLSVDVGTTTGKILQVATGNKLPIIDGSNLTNLDASHLTTGSLPSSSLPAFSGDVTSSAGSSILTLSTVPISKGGTGATSRANALNNLLPDQTGNSGLFLQTNGTDASWVATPNTGIASLTGDVTASGPGASTATIATDAVNSAKILDGTIGVVDLNFASTMTANSGVVVRNGTQFFNKTCSNNEILVWNTSNGWSCSALPSAGGSGTVTSVTAGTGLDGGSITTSGTISIAAGGVNTTEIANGAVTGAKLETVGGLTAGTYGSASAVPNITVDTKGRVTSISTQSINTLPTASTSSGKFLKSDGTNWSGADVRFSDIKNSMGASAFNIGVCNANQTVKWSALTDMFECQNIASLDAAAITTGTIAAGRLPASATLWQDGGSSRIYYSAGNVGIGTSTASTPLDVNGAAAVNSSFEGVSAYTNTGASYTIPDTSVNIRRLTLSSATSAIRLPAMTSPPGKMYSLTLFVKQDGTGNRALSILTASGDSVKWDSNVAPTIATASGSITILQFIKAADETVWYGSMVWKEN